MMRILTLIIGFGVVLGASVAAFAQDTVPFRATAVAPSERDAILDAYFQGLSAELSAQAGAQGQTGMGEELRGEMQRDFDGFRRRFFTPDTDYRCIPQGNRVTCEVQGSVRLGAVTTAMRSSIRTTEQTLSNSLTFAVSAAASTSAAAPLVVDKLTGAFVASGHKIITGGAVNAAIDKGQIDYSLAVQQVSFSPFAYIAGERRAQGTLTVRFALLDVRRKMQVAVLPTVATASVTGPGLEAVSDELRGELASKAAAEIARQVNNAVVTTQQERGADQAALQRQKSGQTLYLVRLEGVTQRERERIRTAREAIAKAMPSAQVQVDPERSNDTEITIAVTGQSGMPIDNLIDALYEANRESKNFEAVSTGNNQIKVHY